MQSLPSNYQTFIHLSRYSRWRDDLNRRETWEETVTRYIDFFKDKQIPKLNLSKSNVALLNAKLDEAKDYILNLKAMPSMRALMTAGPALEKDNVAGYNCSFLAIDNQYAFDEILYILTCGTGLGFSVQQEYVSKLPEIPPEMYETDTVIRVPDSKIGWATSLRELISLLYAGKIPKWDVSKVRPAGARLKTFGGRASGPGPLVDLFKFVVNVFSGAAGRKLTSLECHDIVCKIADIVVSGGVRRSALISLSDLFDDQLRWCKSGNWFDTNVQRALANNSAVYKSKPDIGTFMEEWISLYRSKTGERGILNLGNLKVYDNGRRDLSKIAGVNPCGEILLRNNGFCNLTEVIIRPEDTLETLRKKVEIATFLGTLQSTLTDFRYIRKKWKNNAEEERLLGVSLTGICDHDVLSNPNKCGNWLSEMKQEAIGVNLHWSKILNINQSTAITCVKPSGTVSQLCDTSSGIHPRFSEYYYRTVRNDKKDPMSKMMRDMGFYVEDDITKPNFVDIFYFPMKSPKKAILRNSMGAIEQLELWLQYKKYWAEHTVSTSVYVKEHEWIKVGAWVYEHFDLVTGISFFPHSDHVYKQAPYQEITKEEYGESIERMVPKNVEWSKLSEYESEDATVSSKELACSAGVCEI